MNEAGETPALQDTAALQADLVDAYGHLDTDEFDAGAWAPDTRHTPVPVQAVTG